MLGVNLLVRLGRKLLSGPVADSGFFPPGYYRHLVLEALEEEDFPGALRHLKWTQDPVLAQLVVLRLRLLAGRHRQHLRDLGEILRNGLPESRRENCLALRREEERGLKLLGEYEAQALEVLANQRRQVPVSGGN
jgi:hypothetical protein